jgi:hypothetical protein
MLLLNQSGNAYEAGQIVRLVKTPSGDLQLHQAKPLFFH